MKTRRLLLLPLLLIPLVAIAAGTRSADQTDTIKALNGSPVYLGRISAGTSAKNNADTTAFTIPAGSLLLIIPSAAVKVLADNDATEGITTTNGVPLVAAEKYYLLLRSDQAYLQAITVSSTSDVDVWRLE